MPLTPFPDSGDAGVSVSTSSLNHFTHGRGRPETIERIKVSSQKDITLPLVYGLATKTLHWKMLYKLIPLILLKINLIL
jgi:hypothetical protein